MYQATARTVILGPDEPEPPDRIAVRLHPTVTKAKGIGYEHVTQAAIRWLEERVQPGMTVCDIGCGTGILALVAARLGARVWAYEINDSVREIARQNFDLNDVPVTLGGEWMGLAGADPFDLVVANLGDFQYGDILYAGKDVWTTNNEVTYGWYESYKTAEIAGRKVHLSTGHRTEYRRDA